MKFETVKSFILTILVGVSLLLTFSLWSYQPNYKPFYNSSYINEVDLGGTEETKKEIVRPDSIIFHKNHSYFGFEDPTYQQRLYEDMQSWTLNDFRIREGNGRPTNDLQVEVIFSDALPMEIANSLFKFNKEVSLPSWSFKRMFITFNEESLSLKVQFLSLDDHEKAEAVINNSKVYEQLWSHISSLKELDEYILYEPNYTPIYLPANKVEMTRRSLAVKSVRPNMLVNALFSNPSVVSLNIGEAYFSDGQRGMRVLQDGRSIEFINPIEANYERVDPVDLLDNSIMNINEHKGWTNAYKLEVIDKSINRVRYRQQYEGYPVYDSNNLTIIEQQWRNRELYQYFRPLFSLDNSLGSDPVELPSGNAIVDYLKNNSNYNSDKIKDIRVGYHLVYLDNTSYSITLEPAWYMNYNEDWKELTIDELTYREGGTEDEMESN